MRKTVLLPGLCLLLCACVCGIQERDFDRDYAGSGDYEYNDELNNEYESQPTFFDRHELPDLEEEQILNMEVLKSLVEDIEEAAREIALETGSDQDRRIKFGKLGHLIKPIKFLSSLHKPHKLPSPDLSLDLGAEIVVEPPAESSETEE